MEENQQSVFLEPSFLTHKMEEMKNWYYNNKSVKNKRIGMESAKFLKTQKLSTKTTSNGASKTRYPRCGLSNLNILIGYVILHFVGLLF